MTNEINRMTKVKISEVLHLAADKYLASNREEYLDGRLKYSCDAVSTVLFNLNISLSDSMDMWRVISEGLRNMGVAPCSLDEFAELEGDRCVTEQAQGARYTWLKFAAMIAEEQGV